MFIYLFRLFTYYMYIYIFIYLFMYYKLKYIVWEPFQKSGANETHFLCPSISPLQFQDRLR